MTYFCLFFDRANQVKVIERLPATNKNEAFSQAAVIKHAHSNLHGYEVWEQGRRILVSTS